MYFFESLIYEQEDIEFNEEDLEADETGEQPEAVDTVVIPIKRYYLIQKLKALNTKLTQLRIKNDILNTVISFIDSFSYESLVSITNKLVEDIYLQIQQQQNPKEEPET